MTLTKLGKFAFCEQPKGMPKPVKFILSKFSSGREEDKFAGYISFLKTGPKLLKFVPVKKRKTSAIGSSSTVTGMLAVQKMSLLCVGLGQKNI